MELATANMWSQGAATNISKLDSPTAMQEKETLK